MKSFASIKRLKQSNKKQKIHEKGRKNSSFMSNQDLLQNFRNKSSIHKVISRDISVCQLSMHKQPSQRKVNLIPKKNYGESSIEKIFKDQKFKPVSKKNSTRGFYQGSQIEQKQNTNMLSNLSSALPTSRAKKLQQNSYLQIKKSPLKNNHYSTQTNQQEILNKVLKELLFVYDEISSDQIQLKMILNKNIRRIKELFTIKNDKQEKNKGQKTMQKPKNSQFTGQKSQFRQLQEKIAQLKRQLSQKCVVISQLMKEKAQLKQVNEKLRLVTNVGVENGFKSAGKQINNNQESQLLQSVSFKAEKAIDSKGKKPGNQQYLEEEQFFLLLKAQADKIQELMHQKEQLVKLDIDKKQKRKTSNPIYLFRA